MKGDAEKVRKSIDEYLSMFYPADHVWCRTPGVSKRACLGMTYYLHNIQRFVNLLFCQDRNAGTGPEGSRRMDQTKIKVCIFDVNGGLIDSNLANAQAMAQAFSDDPFLQQRIVGLYLKLTGIDRGGKIRTIQEKIMGKPFQENEFELLWERLKNLTRVSMVNASLLPGCKEVLASLGELDIIRVALSNTPLVELQDILVAHNLESLLDFVRGGGDWPKSESLARLLQEFQFKPEKCLFMGDGKGDLAAARYTRVPFAAIDPGTGEFEGEDGFHGPYKHLADWGQKVLGIII